MESDKYVPEVGTTYSGFTETRVCNPEGRGYVMKMRNLYNICLREKYFCNDELTKRKVK